MTLKQEEAKPLHRRGFDSKLIRADAGNTLCDEFVSMV
jgi:hypothetical protein